MTREELLWLVGFYEGEGSCGCYVAKHHRGNKAYTGYQLTASIGQKERTVVEDIKRMVGCGCVSKNGSVGLGTEQIWKWKASAKQARDFLLLVRPYMRHPGKIAQLDLALAIDKEKTNPNYFKRGAKC